MLSNPPAYAKFVCGLITREMPSAMPFLQWEEASWKRRDGLLIAEVDRMGVEYLTSQGIGHRVEALLKDLFGVELRVALEPRGDEEARLQEIARRRDEEQARMAEIALKACAAEPNGASCKALSKQLLGKAIAEEALPISELGEGANRVTVRGEILKSELRDLKNGSKLCAFALTDFTAPCPARRSSAGSARAAPRRCSSRRSS